MTHILKGVLRRISAGLAALGIAVTVTGFTVAGTASPALADPVGVQNVSCNHGTGWGYPGGNPAAGERNYAWARCVETGDSSSWYRFRVEWSCTGEGYMRYGSWTQSLGRTMYGWCGEGKRVDVVRSKVENIGP